MSSTVAGALRAMPVPTSDVLRHHASGAVVYLLTLGLTSGALGVLHGLDATPPRPLELAVLIAASAAATVTRYVALRSWVFAPARYWRRAAVSAGGKAPARRASVSAPSRRPKSRSAMSP